jgi:DNA-binding MarR family transcriptional regulator/GNAT superfamily N-acetyltransferase
MLTDEIQHVRRFNRTVTQRIGALSDEYLSRQRPLGASRLLWEIASDGSDARSLRTRLDLDSGYLSRLLRMLENEGLVTVEPHADDQRVRLVRLTDAGHSERAEIDRRSDELAHSLLSSLDEGSQRQLLDAMATVERLLTAGLVDVRIVDPSSEAAEFCIRSYFAELDARFDTGFDLEISKSADITEFVEPTGLLLVAHLHEEPVGCGALRFYGGEGTDVKRMWVAKSTRGLGVGRRILNELERHARERGTTSLRLETNRNLLEAINLYRSAGYVEVDAFNSEPYAHHWFAKELTI